MKIIIVAAETIIVINVVKMIFTVSDIFCCFQYLSINCGAPNNPIKIAHSMRGTSNCMLENCSKVRLFVNIFTLTSPNSGPIINRDW